MNKYENGKIYKIICSETERVYIGSTIQTLKKRLGQHILKKKCMSKDFIEPKIYLVENYSCKSKNDLELKERHYIENTDCVNYQKPARTPQQKKEYGYKYYNENKHIKDAWRLKNKEKILLQQREWTLKNKEKSKEIIKKSNLKNNVKITCECGKEFKKYEMPRHIKSKYHIKHI